MIDWRTVSTFRIPEGEVERVTHGSTILWEKSKADDPLAGFTQVEYITFTGEQMIDTGVSIDYESEIEAVFTRESSTNMYLYGVRSTNNVASVTAYLSSNGAWRFGSSYKTLTIAVRTNFHRIVQNKSGVIVNGSLNKYNTTVTSFYAPPPLTIGAARAADGLYGDPTFSGKISEFIIRKNGVEVLHYIPYKNADGVYGFWDIVSKEFKTSITSVPLTGA